MVTVSSTLYDWTDSIGGAASRLRKHEKAHLAGCDGSLHNGYTMEVQNEKCGTASTLGLDRQINLVSRPAHQFSPSLMYAAAPTVMFEANNPIYRSFFQRDFVSSFHWLLSAP